MTLFPPLPGAEEVEVTIVTLAVIAGIPAVGSHTMVDRATATTVATQMAANTGI
jgi:hypothetical protein